MFIVSSCFLVDGNTFPGVCFFFTEKQMINQGIDTKSRLDHFIGGD
ncbi:hypothetical protein NC99_20950 [Sunxiuqinia dokdonensis]|uniref:Uncharacterized protein n=1 Tax=Sunxiuqinia dokdonensis TaxID=1409788 RepID=A0A0L8V903_9BACT|nr:hypothetical protein NC99_20950 [Sunxiuqinia dokdonensis]